MSEQPPRITTDGSTLELLLRDDERDKRTIRAVSKASRDMPRYVGGNRWHMSAARLQDVAAAVAELHGAVIVVAPPRSWDFELPGSPPLRVVRMAGDSIATYTLLAWEGSAFL